MVWGRPDRFAVPPPSGDGSYIFGRYEYSNTSPERGLGRPGQAERRSGRIANQYSVAEVASAELAQSCLDSLCQVQEITTRALARQWHTETAGYRQAADLVRSCAFLWPLSDTMAIAARSRQAESRWKPILLEQERILTHLSLHSQDLALLRFGLLLHLLYESAFELLIVVGARRRIRAGKIDRCN